MEAEIALQDVPLTPGGANYDFKKVRHYEYVRVDPVLSWKTLGLIGPESDVSDDEPDRKDVPLSDNDIKDLLSSPMIEVRKRRSKPLNDDPQNDKFNPFNIDVQETSLGWHKNYQQGKRRTIAVMKRLSFVPNSHQTRKSVPNVRLNTESPTINEIPQNHENCPPIEDSDEQILELLMDSVRESRPLLRNEDTRLSGTMSDWKHILDNESDIPPEAQGSISSTVGRTKILLDKRFKATFDLLNKAEAYVDNGGKIHSDGDKNYRPGDIFAFVDLLINEIKHIDAEYDMLLKCRTRGWTEEDNKEPLKVEVVRKPLVAKRSKIMVKSRLNLKNIRANAARSDPTKTIPTATVLPMSADLDDSFGDIDRDSSFTFESKSPVTSKTLVRETVRSNSVIKSATGTPVHYDTPRPRKSTRSSKVSDFALPTLDGILGPKKRSPDRSGFIAPVSQPKKARKSRF